MMKSKCKNVFKILFEQLKKFECLLGKSHYITYTSNKTPYNGITVIIQDGRCLSSIES